MASAYLVGSASPTGLRLGSLALRESARSALSGPEAKKSLERGQMKPSGQRQAARYRSQACSVANHSKIAVGSWEVAA